MPLFRAAVEIEFPYRFGMECGHESRHFAARHRVARLKRDRQGSTMLSRRADVLREPRVTGMVIERVVVENCKHLQRLGVEDRSLGMEESVGVALHEADAFRRAHGAREPLTGQDIGEASLPRFFRKPEACFRQRKADEDLRKLRAIQTSLRRKDIPGIPLHDTEVREQADARDFRRAECPAVTVEMPGGGRVIQRKNEARNEENECGEQSEAAHNRRSVLRMTIFRTFLGNFQAQTKNCDLQVANRE